MTGKPTLFTTPIFYPNSKLHIGHTYTLILTDILCKLFKVINQQAYLLTGLDEHGNKVFNSAKNNNMDITDWLNMHFSELQKLCDSLHIKVDIWSRTTNEEHIQQVQNIWKILEHKGYIYKGIYSGYYSEKDECFVDINDLVLKDEKYYTQDGAPVYYLQEPCWFLKLNKQAMSKIVSELQVIPYVRINELLQIVNSDNLPDLCISRQGGWGIPIPNQENETIYVWLDALINYISQFSQINMDLSNNMVHVIGKDIFKFHGIYWPYLLKQANYENMPQLLVHNWWIMHDKKMSKSFGNVLYPQDLIDKYGYAAVRFYFIYTDLVNGDQYFDESEIPAKFNQFIVDKFSNLIYRTWIILNRNEYQEPIIATINMQLLNIERDIKELNIKSVLNNLFAICNELNTIFDQKKAWLPENLDVVINIAGQLVSIIPYFQAILSDDKLTTINFNQPAFHIYNRLNIE